MEGPQSTNILVPGQRYDELANNAPNRKPIYPALNVFFSPRVFRDRIDQRSTPLRLYTKQVRATNIQRFQDKPIPDSVNLRNLELKDGLIYKMYSLNIPKERINSPALKVKLLICVCMYNESKNAINLTLEGIYNNLPHLSQWGISPQQVAVVLVQDGILKLVKDRQTRTYVKGANSMVEFYRRLDEMDGKPRCELQQRINTILDQMENFKRKGLSSLVENNRDFPPSIQKNIALLYQNLWYPGITDGRVYEHNPNRQYLKLFSCFKHLNGTKLSSHLWFFEGFCRYLLPQTVVLLDVGTKPDPYGVVNLLKGFTHDKVGGVAGLLSVDSNFPSEQDDKAVVQKGTTMQCLRDTFFSVERAQQYEYIISHLIDKNAESALGFLHVLPGAWSAYRFQALMQSDRYQPNLLQHSYFKLMLNPETEERDHREANMYLAEDRILSLGIYCQPGENYTLAYVPNAVARTDPMKNHEDLMKQRRRWINSSMYAFLYVWRNYHYNSGESSHSFFDKYIKLNFSMLIAMLSLMNSYFGASITFYIIYASIQQISVTSTATFVLSRVVGAFYCLVFAVGVGGSLMGNAWIKYAHYVSVAMGVIGLATIGLVSYNIIGVYIGAQENQVLSKKNFSQLSVFVLIIVNLGLYFLLLLLHMFTHPQFVCRLFMDQISYFSYQGAYTQTLLIHAFCNVDDVSWGTKGAQGHGQGKKYEGQKIKFVAAWLFYNCMLAYIMIYIDEVIPWSQRGDKQNRKIVMIIIGFYFTTYFVIKIGLAIANQIFWICSRIKESCCSKPKYPERVDRMRVYWHHMNEEYRQLALRQ